jgi:hypothetical protein
VVGADIAEQAVERLLRVGPRRGLLLLVALLLRVPIGVGIAQPPTFRRGRICLPLGLASIDLCLYLPAELLRGDRPG